MSDGMGREFMYLSSHATNRYFIPNWGNDCKFRSYYVIFATLQQKDSLMNEILSYIIINEANFAA